jgi:tetratricopeptide (TPR) repeat protein
MLALYRCGRQGDALEAYARTRAHLTTELGLEPGPALQALQAEILAQSPTLQPAGDRPDAGSGVACKPVMLAFPRALRVSTGLVFVGRDGELEHLHKRWTQLSEGARGAVLVGGEPGIGKTRLAAEFARAVHREGTLVLYGRCDEGLAVPYQPFVEALRPYARAVGLDRLHTELGDLAAQLGRLLPELARLGEPMRADPESERFALFEAVAALIETMTRDQPTLIVLDDLHWAANPTLLLLRHLIRSERQLGTLLLCTYRETELDLDQPLAQLLADLHRDASAERLTIRGLNDTAIAALLEATVGHALHEPDALVRGLAAQTAGNPFFLRELLADVAESDAIMPGSERLSLDNVAARLEIPEGLRHVIGQRVARLSAPGRRAMRIAAVAGSTISLLLLERVLGERADVLDALDDAVAAGLLVEAGHGDYVFAHALVRQTIYRQLGPARRMRLHRQLGEALETLQAPDAHVEALAYHFAQAAADGQAVKAADYALAAGHRASARLGHEEAAAHCERGLQALRLGGWPDEERRCELLLALGDARWGAGELDKARHTYGAAAEVADKLGDATALARAALGFCGPHRFELATAVTAPVADLLQRALATLSDDDSALRAQLMGRLAAAIAYRGVEDRRPQLACRALEMARRVADKETLADVLASSLWAIRGPDGLHESLAMARELGRLADEVGDDRLRALAHWWLLDHLLELGDADSVEREVETLQRLTEVRRERAFKWVLAVVEASRAHLAGRIADCETLAHKASAHRFHGHDEVAAHTFGVQMFFVRSAQGRLDEPVRMAERFVQQYPQLPIWRCARLSMYAQLGHRTQASQEFERLASADFCDFPCDALWMPSLSALCGVAAFLGDVPRAQLLYGLLSPYADHCVVTFSLLCAGSVSRPLGLLATTLSRYEVAARHFEQALKMNAQIRSPLWIARTQHDYAHMLVVRNKPGDEEKALELVNGALDTAQRLGLPAFADKARRLKQAAVRA